MNLEKFNKLKQTLGEKNFEENYSIIDKILYFTSYLGNAASVAFAYFFLNTILITSTDEFPAKWIILPILSILSLSTFELLKRFVFRKFVTAWVTNKSIVKETVYNLVMSVLLVSASFYLSLSGAEKFADRNKQIENKTEIKVKTNLDSLNKVFDSKINKLDADKATWVDLVNKTKSIKLRSEYNNLITNTNNDIKALETERKEVLKAEESKINSKANKEQNETHTNQIAFILISTFIELLILIGVWFDTYYDWICYNEYSDKLNASPAYFNYALYVKLMNILFNGGKIKINDKVASASKFAELVKASGIRTTQKQIKDFLSICNHLNITTVNSKNRFAEKSFVDANEIIKNHFNF